MDLVLTFRNVTAEAFNGNGTGDFDYRANLTESFVSFFKLEPSATWSEPIDGQREATVTLGNVEVSALKLLLLPLSDHQRDPATARATAFRMIVRHSLRERVAGACRARPTLCRSAGLRTGLAACWWAATGCNSLQVW